MIKLYNTATRQLEKFKPLTPGRVSIYSCGPTVYDRQHIGNLRKALFDDLLKRTLTLHGFQVYSVTNITDVGHLVSDGDEGEDKMEKGSKRENLTAWDIAKKYEDLWKQDLEKLHVTESDHYPRATDYITEQINLIKRLEKKGYTYTTSDGVYFNTAKFPEYGDFAKLDVANLSAGERVDLGEKKNPTDFALWKFSPTDEKRQMEWESPWGVGFPGWHSECVAMSDKILHAPIDIHTGGKDHIPVHHTNEIAQFKAETGQNLANYWVHSYFLTVKSNKMSKSAGTFIILDDIIERGYSPLDFRLLTLMGHYRSDIDFSWEILDQARATRARLIEFTRRLNSLTNKRNKPLEFSLKKVYGQFKNALYNDLDSPKALAILFDFVRDTNAQIDAGEPIPRRHIIKMLQRMERVLALDLFIIETIPQEVTELATKRQQARQNKNYDLSDQLRDKIDQLGYTVKDTPQGFEISKK